MSKVQQIEEDPYVCGSWIKMMKTLFENQASQLNLAFSLPQYGILLTIATFEMLFLHFCPKIISSPLHLLL